jgi:glycerol-3-phosphate acyltransferase PlsX
LMEANDKKIRIAIDAMGGDYAPQEIVQGAVEAAKKDNNLELILVGPFDILEKELAKYDISGLPIHRAHADDFIREEENPALAVYRKPNSSIVVATKMVRAGRADGLLGATATGSLVTSAMQFLGMLDGIERPVLGAVLSLIAPTTVTLDLGVNMDCKPRHLLNFAIIGTVYARVLLGVPEPKVALLNIGKEGVKGNQLIRETYPLLEKSGLNFIGNVEGHEILSRKANVIVCDGFVGNPIFKFSESVGNIIDNYIKSKFKDDPEVSCLLGDKLEDLIGLLALPDVVGGGILWGVDGVVAKAHGNSRAPMVTKRLGQTKMAIERDVVGCLKAELSRIRKNVNL